MAAQFPQAGLQGLPGFRPGGIPQGQFPPNPQQFLPQNFGGFPGAIAPHSAFPGQGYPQQSRRNIRKEAEFAKGLYVYNFEEITVELLFNHFNKIKPVSIIKFPKTKERLSKKFAFVYFHSKDDANFVRECIQKDTEAEAQAVANGATDAELKKLSRRHKILLKPIKVSSLNLNEFSKLVLKPKIVDPSALAKEQKEYFNDSNLEKEIKRLVPDSKFNRVIVPRDQKSEESLPYARAYFDLENKDEINNIKELLERDEVFSKHIQVLPFIPFIPTNSNTLYVKGLVKAGEVVDNLTHEFHEFFKSLNPDWKILSVYTSTNEKDAWGNVSFDTPEQCKQAFEKLKPLDVKFRGNVLFANIKNQADSRAVIIYELRDGVSFKEINDFFKDVSDKSAQIVPEKKLLGAGEV